MYNEFAINEIHDSKTKAFAIACYDMNSIEELESLTDADAIDMAEWGITEDQWKEAVAAALEEKRADEQD